MSWKLRVLISAMLLAPSAVMGLGLGEIRLNSALNEPLSAEIDLVAATPDEVGALQAQLASAEVFQRYGLDRPAYLNSIEFRVGRGQDGRSVLLVRSSEAISEPFVSFLVDVNWSRGRLLREYTVLLDPPVMAAAGEGPAPAAIAAPTSMPAPAPSAQPPVAETAPATDGSTYTVQRGDTLYQIAGSHAGGDPQAAQRLMIGIFRANPEAFNGNINEMHAGAILRVPGSADIADIGAADAASEVRRQTTAWRAAGGGADAGRLRLVTPQEGAADAGTAETASSGNVRSQIESLERDIAEQRRLLELRNQELAKLQQDLARTRAAESAAVEKAAAEKAAADKAAADEAAAAQAAADQAAADQAATPPADEAAVAPEDDTPRAEAPPEAAEPAPGAKAKPAPAADEKSILERLTDNWMFLLGALGLLLAGLFGYSAMRRRREADVDVALKGFELPATAPVPSETMRLRALATGDETAELERPATLEESDNFLVEERPVARPKAEAPRPSVGHEETISAEAALDLDQADPLAEADFHMAYGLYDQAVDLVRMALQHSPDRNDLKLKLAEIHFVAGDTPQFLSVARDLRKTLGPGGDWDRIVIMGRQLAPDEPMFAGGVRDAGVDLSLEGGDNLVDIDLLSAPEGDEGLDLDLGKVAAISDSTDATGENTAIEFNLDDVPLSPTTTQKIVNREGPGTVEMPTLELPSSETPTVETPTLRLRGGQKAAGPATDVTAEMAIDDLGLDVGDLSGLPDADDATAIAAGNGDEATQIARREDSTQVMTLEDEATALMPASGTSTTSMLPKLDPADVDFDLGGATDADDSPTAQNRMVTEQLPQLSDLEPVTMSEVGTKLDLARAYMDMGDPDGARNILQEVLAEGSASQKQEARRLIDSLPGA
ncbi:MAG: FimV/HubP family polar landmark protein [Steroidobacteraceae bacterium]